MLRTVLAIRIAIVRDANVCIEAHYIARYGAEGSNVRLLHTRTVAINESLALNGTGLKV